VGGRWKKRSSSCGLTSGVIAHAGLGKREEFVDYGPLGNLIGEGKNSPERRYRQFVESGIAQIERGLEEAMELSSKVIGRTDFYREVEEQHQTCLLGIGDPAQVAMRQIDEGQDPERVLDAVARALKVDRKALTRGRRRAPARCLAMLLW
jgi:hypothetical protein